MTTLSKVKSDLDEARSAVGAAETLLGQGQVVDLGGLETHVEGLCNDIGALQPDERVELKPDLVSLIDSLNRLAVSIETRNREIGQQLKGTADRQRAASAYRTGPKPGPSR